MIYRDARTNPSVGNPDLKREYYDYERYQELENGRHIKNTTCICNSSASHTYGNVMSLVEHYTLKALPTDLFRTIMSATTLAPRQLLHLPHQLHKKEMPIMVMVPRIVFGQEENRFLGHTLFNSRITNTHSLWGEGSLIPLAEDKRKNIYIHGHYNRAVMYVDFVCSFNTYSEQVNFLSYMHNMIPVGHNQFIKAPLELYIPKSFSSLITNLADIDGGENEVYDTMNYMNSIFYHPITYKLKGGSNSKEYFMYYLADVDVVYNDIQFNNGVKDGQIRRNFDVTFTVRCEFNTIGYFTLNSPNMEKPVILPDTEDKAILPIFSDVINLDDFILPEGWSILSWPIFKLGYQESSVSLDPIMNNSIRACIKYHMENGLPMSTFIQIQFRENGEILSDELYHIDWDTLTLYLSTPDYHRTYRLIITVSYQYINELIKKLYDLE